MDSDVENNLYFLNDEVGVAFAFTEYGYRGYDYKWGEFSADIPDDVEAKLFDENKSRRPGSRIVDYNEACDYVMEHKETAD